MINTVTILGADTLQITPDPVAENSTEVIPRRHIVGVFPLKFQQKPAAPDDENWAYPFNTITKVRFVVVDGRRFDIELQNVSNQNGWNTGTLSSLNTAIADIEAWLSGGTIVTNNFIIATGGTVTTDGDYKIHTFTGDGTFTVTAVGSAPNDTVEYLVVGGGGGGIDNLGRAGGGGAGGFRTAAGLTVSVQAYPVTVGAGGAVYNGHPANNGFDSIFSSITSEGGGHGGASFSVGGLFGGDGGSGGGGGNGYDPFPTIISGGSGTVGQGNDGGDGGGDWSGGGGGGASVAGVNGVGNNGGNGGNGTASSISGASVTYACGGGGGGNTSGGTGGTGGGGTGGTGVGNATSGAANTGGGAGSVFDGPIGGNGGSGIVIIKYKFQ